MLDTLTKLFSKMKHIIMIGIFSMASILGFSQSEVKKIHYDNGQLKFETNYVDGKEDGLHRGWYEEGQLKIETYWKAGVQNGSMKIYFKNGQLKTERNFIDGKEDGLVKDWYEDGKLKFEAIYKNGEVVSSKKWDKDGNPIKKE